VVFIALTFGSNQHNIPLAAVAAAAAVLVVAELGFRAEALEELFWLSDDADAFSRMLRQRQFLPPLSPDWPAPALPAGQGPAAHLTRRVYLPFSCPGGHHGDTAAASCRH
jgi:hypothetical protein